MIKVNSNGLYTAVVYMYKLVCPDSPENGFKYIGMTLDEAERRRKWNNPNTKSYGGKKVMEARRKFSPSAFVYTVLDVLDGADKKTLRKDAETREGELIKTYDSIAKGYNRAKGGTGNKGYHPYAASIAQMVATRKALDNYKHTDATKAKISAGLYKRFAEHPQDGKAVKVTFADGTTQTFRTMTEAAKATGYKITTVSDRVRQNRPTKTGIKFELC